MSPRPAASKGLAAAKAKALDGRSQHQEWLDLTEVSGPFLTMPVLLQAWPQLDAVGKDQRARLRAHHADWQTDTTAGRDAWVAHVLRSLLEWGDALVWRQSEADDVPDLALDRFSLDVREHGVRLRADFALTEPGTDLAAEPDTGSAAKRVRVLGMALPSGTAPTARPKWGDDWSASPADRLARLLRHHDIPLGLLTDGRWWCLVWAPVGGVTTTAVFDAINWNEAAERNVVRAFVSLLRRRRFFEYAEPETLVGLLKKSLDAGDEVTDALGVQVRQAVELLVDAIGRADARSMEHGAPGLRASNVEAGAVYRGAVAVMMRVVFLLFAEERGLLPADNEVYAQSYSARFLRAELKARADAEGEASLEHTTAAWHRLIALFHAVHDGVQHPQLKLPAYDGSIFDPDTYPWLEKGSPLLPIDDRTVLHMLQSVQEVRVGTGRQRETRTLSFRALDVEQIGYVYEGLLSYDGERAVETMVGLIGPAGMEHEVPLRELESLAASVKDVKALAKKIHDTWKDPKPPASVARLEKLLVPAKGEAAAEAKRLLQAASRDAALTERLLPFFGLLRRDLRGLPVVIAAGSLFVTESSLRKNTGTHYTPRTLAEEVVKHALEPLVYEPGPLQTANESEWVPKSAEQILELKVADIAMGSAAFLVAACRYLADRLIEAWVREGREDAVTYRAGRAVDEVTAADADSDLVVIEARRQIIEHCLYGVDINPMAVEMAKLSLWLVSMDPKRPFTFLDDRLVAGDSLLGVTSLDQLKAVHLNVEKGDLLGAAADAEGLVSEVVKKRHDITEIKGNRPEALGKKRELLREVRQKTAKLRLVGDLVVGAALATCASGRVPWYEADGGEQLRDLFPMAARVARGVVTVPEAEVESSEVVAKARGQAREWLASELPEGGMRRVPVHWPLEFAEVFAEQGGFDAVVGNPPFLGGSKVTGSSGEGYREYLVEHIATGKRGNADLVAYFFLRAHQLLNTSGQSGLIATNTLAQGDTREVGLDQLIEHGTEIRRAIKSAPWPSKSATLEYCTVWTTRKHPSSNFTYRLGKIHAPNGISTSLNPATRASSWGERLKSNSGISFNGSKVDSLGFTLAEKEARNWIGEDASYSQVLFHYMNGREVNTLPNHHGDRWIISFQDWPEARAMNFPKAYAQVKREVKPEREKNNRTARRERWWQFAERAPGLYSAISPLDQCIVIALVSKVVMPVMVSTGQVFSHKLGIFASDDSGLLAMLSSAPHYWWALDRSSTMKADLNYSPTDVFETLVRPPQTDRLRTAGTRLDEFRRELMIRRNIGLTATYNLVHDETCQDSDIIELRRIHKEIDKATVEAYGWNDLLDETGATPPADPTHQTFPLNHDFHNTDQGTRYTIGPLVRTEIIDRLRQLNHQAYADEVLLGLHKKPKEHPDMPPPSAEAWRKKAEQARKSTMADFEDGTLFRPEGTIF
ncbi:Eco57I restriction-modification methylase domain-containing protein [Streptomyces lonegramiae]|uniref:site-specific DNA-methyltransferase (adenine-specific) n=1 Tax=Streptomyces lonegramiae TaxID=3075524 RepID=A0ABU2XQM4_9ACTN|nr:DNA methyltransferase [Streptomyces sp. DSM 41529]MDT0548228.1 DNA methyltransferase [Streptomyces sp. DSM 41529]